MQDKEREEASEPKANLSQGEREEESHCKEGRFARFQMSDKKLAISCYRGI